MGSSKTVSVVSPAKVNLFLAVTGMRDDGYHDLVSLVTPLLFGDYLTLEIGEGVDSLVCNSYEVPLGENNLILRALEAFRSRYDFKGAVCFELEKYIPIGAGLGGGSSNAVAALEALNLYFGYPLSKQDLLEIAEQLGSDCPLFLESKPIIMRGRGEKITFLDESLISKLSGKRVLLFKPTYSINTGWAYNELRDRGDLYLSSEVAEVKLNELKERLGKGEDGVLEYSCNNFEPVIYGKHQELQKLSESLKNEYGLDMRLSGSGSACFCLLAENTPVAKVKETVSKAIGSNVFMIETFLK